MCLPLDIRCRHHAAQCADGEVIGRLVVLAALRLSRYDPAMAKAKSPSKVKSKPPPESRFLVLLEQIEAQNRATIEAVFGVERRLTEKIDQLEQRLTLRIEALEIAVRKNSE